MRQKICFIMPKYRSSAATHFNYLYQLISLLEKDMDLFLIVERGDRPDFLKKGKAYVLKFRFLPIKLLENFLILLYARMNGYQDFYIHYSFLSSFNASLIVKVLGGRTFYWNCGLPWLYQRGFFREGFERLVYRLVTFLVTGTEGLEKMYAEHYHLPLAKIKVMPNWIDTSRFREKPIERDNLKAGLNISETAKIILFVHHLSRRKGTYYLPEIVESLRNENAVLLIAGEGPEREWVESEVKKRGLEDWVRFLGCVPNNEIQDYFQIADAFILPSEEEGFPHVLLEAMAAGVPFVAFDVGGVPEIVPPECAAYLIPEREITTFSNKVQELLRLPPADIEAIKKKELNWVRQFDVRIAVESFKKLLV